MFGLLRILLLIYSIIELRYEKMAVLAAPSRIMSGAFQVQSHQRIAPIALLPVADPEEDGQPESLINFRDGNVLDVNDDLEAGDWEPKNTPYIQLWPLARRFNYKRPGGIILSPSQGWQPPRRIPEICLTGPSVFRKCCILLNELGHDSDAIRHQCCVKVKSTTTTAKAAVTATKDNLSTSQTPHHHSTAKESSSSRTVETSSIKTSSVATEKPLRPKNESASKLNNESKQFISTRSDESETVYNVPGSETDIEPQVGEAASASKLPKVKSKEKSPPSPNKAEDDGTSLEDVTNAGKSVPTSQPITAITGKSTIPDDTIAKEVMHGQKVGIVTETAVKQSNEMSQSEEESSEEDNSSKWDVKNKAPIKVVSNLSTKTTTTVGVTKDRSTTTLASDAIEEVSHISIKPKNSSSNQPPAKSDLTNRNNAGSVSSASPLPVPRAQLKSSSTTPKVAPPKNKEHNCTFVITGAISGYGYYVYAHSQATNRPDSVKECSQRNMTLAFVTNQNEENLLRRLMDDNSSYWIGLSKGEGKKRYRWDDGTDAGFYISRYVDLESDDKSTKDGLPTYCIIKMTDGKMKVECAANLTQQLAFPMCMYRPPKA